MSAEGGAAAQAYLRAYAKRADERLRLLLDGRTARWSELPFDLAQEHELLAEYVLRPGKRVRGALVLLGNAAAGGPGDDAVLDASLAFELLHAYLLAYDDIMDRDETRRGRPALHVAAAARARGLGLRDAPHRGLSVTLLLGMAARTLAVDLLARGPFSGDVRARALQWFNDVEEGVVVGQLLDVCARPAATPAELAEVHRRKTGLYTMEGPLVLGALLAGAAADVPVAGTLRAYAKPLGEAFQLVDDVLGAVGDEATTGKPTLGDLREGRRSAVLVEALARLPPDAAQALESLAGTDFDAAAAARARALFVSSGAVDAVRARARALAGEAAQALVAAPLPAEVREVLSSLAILVAERQS